MGTIHKEVNRHLDCRVRSQMAVIGSLVLRFQIADDDDADDDDDDDDDVDDDDGNDSGNDDDDDDKMMMCT